MLALDLAQVVFQQLCLSGLYRNLAIERFEEAALAGSHLTYYIAKLATAQSERGLMQPSVLLAADLYVR